MPFIETPGRCRAFFVIPAPFAAGFPTAECAATACVFSWIICCAAAMKLIVFPQLFRRFFIIILLIPGIASAEIYSWRDAHGKLQFSDRKPPDIETSTVSLQLNRSEWKRFDIDIRQVGIQLAAEALQRINDDINAVYCFYHKKLYLDVYKTIPVKVKLFGARSDYKSYVRRSDGSYKNTRGIFFSSRNEIAVYMREDREGTFRTIKHEASHAIIHALLPYTPDWLNEGIAENMEVVVADEKSVYLEPHHENHRNLSRHIQRHILPSIEEMISYKSSVWKKKNRGSSYALQTQAGELVRMLLAEPVGKSFISKILYIFKFGDRTLVSHLADKHYIGGTFAMQNRWERWIRRGHSQRVDL